MNDSFLKRQLATRMRQAPSQPSAPQEQAGYERFSASQLYCPKCQRAMPVREKHLLVLAGGNLYDYLCTQCGTSLGTRKS